MQESLMAVLPQAGDSDSAPTTAPLTRSALTFFALVFALSTPFWLIGVVTGRQLSPDPPVSSFIWVCPVIAASMLVYRESGTVGLTALLRRSVDYPRVRAQVWYVPIVLLPPGVYAVTYGVMREMGLPLPRVHFPLLAAVAWFLGFFIAAECEELGWSATRSTRCKRGGAHSAPASSSESSGPDFIWCHWCRRTAHRAGSPGGASRRWRYGCCSSGSTTTRDRASSPPCCSTRRGTWLRSGPVLDFGPTGYSYDAQRISALILAAVAAIVIVVWRPRTLTQSTFA